MVIKKCWSTWLVDYEDRSIEIVDKRPEILIRVEVCNANFQHK